MVLNTEATLAFTKPSGQRMSFRTEEIHRVPGVFFNPHDFLNAILLYFYTLLRFSMYC